MKISISKEAVVVILIIVIGIACVYIIYHFYPKSTTTTSYNFFGITIPFRTDLYKANNISVYPDNDTVYNMMWGQQLENITIVWVNSSENNMVAVEAFEITYKMNLAYKHIGNLNGVTINVMFNHMVVDSYDNLTATENNPIIALVPPMFSNETAVRAENNVIYIKGKTFGEFDLATVKFLMVALAINL
jgi:hypothetical protein